MEYEMENKIRRKLVKMRLKPIRVFCFHQVSDKFDASTMYECDWMQTELFKQNIIHLKKQYTFISLLEAYNKLRHDVFRYKQYAVLTFDDGCASLKNIIPWLVEQRVPITVFVNPEYLLGYAQREKSKSLTRTELEELLKIGADTMSIASHGWNHSLCTELIMADFIKSVKDSVGYLSQYDSYIPFFAYPCGEKTAQNDIYLLSQDIIPVYINGEANYDNTLYINREIL